MSGSAPAPELSQRLRLIVDLLRRHLAAYGAKDRVFGVMLARVLWNRLSRTLSRFAAIAERHRAGTLRQPRTGPARPPSPAAAAGDPPRKPPPVRPPPPQRPPPSQRPPPPRDPLPRARGWLLRRVPGCVCYGEYLRLLLAEPEMAALIEAAPQLRPILRPLWRMLQYGPPPPLLQNPRPPSRRRKTRRRRRRCTGRSKPHPTLRATLPVPGREGNLPPQDKAWAAKRTKGAQRRVGCARRRAAPLPKRPRRVFDGA